MAGADQTVLNDTNVIITMNTIVNTDATTFDTSVPSKIKLKKAGLYALTAQTQWSVYTAFFRSVWIADATTGFLSAEGGAADDFNDYPQASGTYIFPVNDVITKTFPFSEAGAAMKAWNDNPAAFTKIQIDVSR